MQQRKLMLATGVAVASVFGIGSAAAAVVSLLPPEETQGMVTYRTGGIAQSEAAAMQQAEAHYPLALEFVEHAKPKNEFLANVEVTIKDRLGRTALKTYSDGPFLLATLPDGKYTVTATDEGSAQTRQVTVAAGKPERLVFTW